MFNSIIKKLFGSKPEPVKPVTSKPKRVLTEDEKLQKRIARMTEEERVLYYYDESRKAGLTRSATQIAMEVEEARQEVYKIHFEFLPKSQNFINCRSLLQFMEKQAGEKYTAWKFIRDWSEAQTGGVCCITGFSGLDNGYEHATECHERWKFGKVLLKRDRTIINGDKRYVLKAGTSHNIQTLFQLQSLEPMAHSVKHINRYFKEPDNMAVLKEYYQALNGVSPEQTEADYQTATDKQKLLEGKYLIDCSYLLEVPFSEDFKETLRNYDIDCLFNPHSEQFQAFINKEFKSTGQKDNG